MLFGNPQHQIQDFRPVGSMVWEIWPPKLWEFRQKRVRLPTFEPSYLRNEWPNIHKTGIDGQKVLPNILQSEKELHIWNPCQIACPSIPVLWILGHSFLRYEGSKVGNRTRFCRNSQSLGGHISHTTDPIGLKCWIWCCGFPNNMYVEQVSLKSETVGFKFSVIFGDLTRNDPIVNVLVGGGLASTSFRKDKSTNSDCRLHRNQELSYK